VRRRDFIRALGAAAAALPVVANAQQKVPLVGFLGSTAAGNWGHFVAAFRAGLKETPRSQCSPTPSSTPSSIMSSP
jgi:hypothetical protein